jgi:hypothetical protein
MNIKQTAYALMQVVLTLFSKLITGIMLRKVSWVRELNHMQVHSTGGLTNMFITVSHIILVTDNEYITW